MLVDASIVSRGPLFGHILLSLGKITSEQLAQALEVQKRHHRYIGEILIDLGFITPEDVAKALGIQRQTHVTRSASAATASPLSAHSA